MTTYYVRADGSVTAANRANATSSGAAATSLSLSEMNTVVSGGNAADGDIFVLSAKGGVFSGAGITNAVASGITYIGETGYRPTLSLASTYRCQVAGVSRNTFDNLIILNAATSGIEFITSGTGHVVRNVEVSGSTNQCFSVENSCTATFYDVIGHNGTDDGLSAHGTAELTVYGGHFYDNNQNLSHVGTSVVRCYDVKFSGAKLGVDSGDLVVGTLANDNSQSYFYDCEFDGGVMLCIADSAIYAEFHRCTFKNRYVGTTVGLTNACVQAGNSGAARLSTVKFYACEFWQPPTGKTQCLLRNGTTGTFTLENCTFAQATETSTGLQITIQGGTTPANTVKNCSFYNCSVGIAGSTASVATVTNCSFYANTANSSGSIVITTGQVTADPLYIDAANNDYRISADSPLIATGTTGSALFDVDNRAYGSTLNIGAHSTEVLRPKVGYRPSVSR